MLTQVVLQCFYSDHDVWCGAAISRHMWSDQRLLISRDSEGGSEDLKRLFSLTWQWDQRPESASEPWPCATGQVRGKEEASGDAEAALPRVCVPVSSVGDAVPAGAGSVYLATSDLAVDLLNTQTNVPWQLSQLAIGWFDSLR